MLNFISSITQRFRNRRKWNREYKSGFWEYLKTPLELERLQVALSMVQTHCPPDAAILEAGCGEGIFYELMPEQMYGSYKGFDLSKVAIAKALKISRPGTSFHVLNMDTFCSTDSYDLILFNECLCYSKHPYNTFRRFLHMLKPEGHMLVSLYEMEITVPIITFLKDRYQVLEYEKVNNRNGTWHIMLFRADADQD